MKTKFKPLPVSRAKTAYGLLSEIRKLIIEEPRRYDQIHLLSRGQIVKTIYQDLAPACGTVGCVAGWTIALKAPRTRPRNMWNGAIKILGLKTDPYGTVDNQDEQLFDEEHAGPRWTNDGVTTLTTIKAHARRGAAHIKRFQKKYASQLKAKRV